MIRPNPLILNVDDDEGGRYAVGRALRQAGFEIVSVGTGAEALDTAHKLRPDLIILDIRLPDIDGCEVCRRIRHDAHLHGTPIVQMSASYIDVSSQVKGLETGADVYLTEPVEPAILVATLRSLLRLKSAENIVRESARQWQSTFDAIGDGVAMVDESGAITRVNKAFATLPDVSEAISAALARVKASGARDSSEVHAAGLDLMLTLDPVKNDAGAVTGAVCVIADVTEKKKLEDQLRQAARLESIGVLAGGIAHDFNNLLTGVLGNAHLLLENAPEFDPGRELIEDIIAASESAADLTKQILAYSGKGGFLRQPVNLSAIANETRTFVRRLIPPHVELRFDTPPELPLIEADRAQMQQVMMNIIINAAEAIPEGTAGLVKVCLRGVHLDEAFFVPGETPAAGEYVELSVTDNGAGMDEATRARIFDPFFTTKFAGRGLGLSAVHGILHAHRSLLRIDTKPGRGSTFRLYFPTAGAGQSETKNAEQPAEAELASGMVLVVDDEQVVRKFAKAALERLGYAVLTAENGEIGVELFREHPGDIQLVILDLAMPVMDGQQAYERIRRISPEARVILISGFSQAEARERFRGTGISGFLGKPFDSKQLREAVSAALKP